MGVVKKSPVLGVAKKSPIKGDCTPAKRTRALSGKQDTPFSAAKMRTPPSVGTGTPKTFTSKIPTKEELSGNGRVQGRSLVKWNRPRMAEKLILHMYYECVRHKVLIPWDAIAHRFHPGSSGGAILQHLNRLRKELISEGHVVPPVPFKTGTCPDPDARGYIRKDMEGNDKETVRPVPWGEYVEDPKYNLPGAYQDDDDELADISNVQPSIVRKSPESPSPRPKSGHGMPLGWMGGSGAQLDDPFAPGLDGTQETDASLSFSSQPVIGSGKMYDSPVEQLSQSFSGPVDLWADMFNAELDPSVEPSFDTQIEHAQLAMTDQANYGAFCQNPYTAMQQTMLPQQQLPVPRYSSPEEEGNVLCTPPRGINNPVDAYTASPFTPPGQTGCADLDDSIESALIFHLSGAYGGFQSTTEV